MSLALSRLLRLMRPNGRTSSSRPLDLVAACSMLTLVCPTQQDMITLHTVCSSQHTDNSTKTSLHSHTMQLPHKMLYHLLGYSDGTNGTGEGRGKGTAKERKQEKRRVQVKCLSYQLLQQVLNSWVEFGGHRGLEVKLHLLRLALGPLEIGHEAILLLLLHEPAVINTINSVSNLHSTATISLLLGHSNLGVSVL